MARLDTPAEYQAVPSSDGYRRGFILCARYGDEWAEVPEAAPYLFDSEADALAFADELENGPQWNEAH